MKVHLVPAHQGTWTILVRSKRNCLIDLSATEVLLGVQLVLGIATQVRMIDNFTHETIFLLFILIFYQLETFFYKHSRNEYNN